MTNRVQQVHHTNFPGSRWRGRATLEHVPVRAEADLRPTSASSGHLRLPRSATPEYSSEMTRDEILLNCLTEGEGSTVDLVVAAGLPERTVRRGLRPLIGSGHVFSPERGRYRLTAQALGALGYPTLEALQQWLARQLDSAELRKAAQVG